MKKGIMVIIIGMVITGISLGVAITKKDEKELKEAIKLERERRIRYED